LEELPADVGRRDVPGDGGVSDSGGWGGDPVVWSVVVNGAAAELFGWWVVGGEEVTRREMARGSGGPHRAAMWCWLSSVADGLMCRMTVVNAGSISQMIQLSSSLRDRDSRG